MAISARIWLSFDLHIGGDYEGIYKWLDSHNSNECGDSIATFIWDANSISTIKNEIRDSLKNSVSFGKKDRVYIVFQKEDGSYAGTFLIGSRKSNPWEGYSKEESSDDE